MLWHLDCSPEIWIRMADFRNESPLREDPSGSSKHLELLVADCDPPTRDLCREIAAGLGYSVLAVDAAATVLSALEARTVDTLLLAGDLPGSDGYQLLKHLRYWYPEMQVIVLASHGDFSAAVQAAKLGEPLNIWLNPWNYGH